MNTSNTMCNVANSAPAENLSISFNSSKSPETRRRAAALKFARESTDVVDPRSELSPALNSPSGVGEIGDNDAQTIPTEEISGDFADNIDLAIAPGSGRALERKPAQAGVLSSVTRRTRDTSCYPGLVAVSSRPTDHRSYPSSGGRPTPGRCNPQPGSYMSGRGVGGATKLQPRTPRSVGKLTRGDFRSFSRERGLP